jgi:predicted ATPase
MIRVPVFISRTNSRSYENATLCLAPNERVAMDHPSETPELRAIVLKSETSDIPKSSRYGESDDAIEFDLSEYFLSARTVAIDAVRRYYYQAMMKRSSVILSKSSLAQTSPPTYHSYASSSTGSSIREDVTSVAVVFPILTGSVGSGTSQLIQYALKRQVCDEQGGYYVHAKFDMQQNADPHRSFIVAWSAFAEEVVRRGPAAIVTMRHTILSACESEISSLLEVIPALRAILEYRDETASPGDGTLVTNNRGVSERRQSASLTPPSGSSSSLQHFLFAFQAFLKAIAHSERPIILVLDCLQWADRCSIDFFCSVLQDVKDIPGFFLIGTHEDGTFDLLRDDDDANQASYLVRKLQEMIQRSNDVVTVEPILIHDLDFSQVKQMLNQTLQQSSLFDLQIEDDICQLVYQHAHGNTTLTTEFLEWLYRLGLLKKDHPGNAGNSFAHWTWDVDRMHREIVVRTKNDERGRSPFFVADLLNALPAEIIELLKVCACFGCLHTEDIILEYVLEYPIRSVLAQAVKLGILDSVGCGPEAFAGTLYCFKHDIFQMAVYDLIPVNSRESFHLEIGRRLWRRLSPDELNQSIFVVLSQLIQGRRLISRPNERYRIVTLCLHAGRKAATLSNFGAASTYLKFGIELLGNLGWKDVYHVALAIHNDACEMEMCAANFEEMGFLVESILQHARCDGDKLKARTTQIYALSVSDRQVEALDLGVQLLRDIGSPLPKSLSVWTLLRKLRSVQNLLKGKSNDFLKQMPLIEDDDILAAMRILHLVSSPVFIV